MFSLVRGSSLNSCWAAGHDCATQNWQKCRQLETFFITDNNFYASIGELEPTCSSHHLLWLVGHGSSSVSCGKTQYITIKSPQEYSYYKFF